MVALPQPFLYSTGAIYISGVIQHGGRRNFTGKIVAGCLERQPVPSIEKLVSARQLAGRPVTIINTEEEFDRRLLSYVQES